MHRQVQERVAVAVFFHLTGVTQGSIHVGQCGVMLGMRVDPQRRQRFDRLHRLPALGFGVNRAKKATHVFL